MRVQLDAAEHELEDLRAIRDALTPFDMPERPGLDLAAAFVAAAERVSGDFYLVAEGPQDSTVLVIGDVVGHGLDAARRAAFVRTAFASTAPYSDDPRKLLGWANVALVERAGPSDLLDRQRASCDAPSREERAPMPDHRDKPASAMAHGPAKRSDVERVRREIGEADERSVQAEEAAVASHRQRVSSRVPEQEEGART